VFVEIRSLRNSPFFRPAIVAHQAIGGHNLPCPLLTKRRFGIVLPFRGINSLDGVVTYALSVVVHQIRRVIRRVWSRMRLA
jgi:hypothetical protein